MDKPKKPTLSNQVITGVLDVWSQSSERNYIPISGVSMLPLIRNGDRVLVEHGGHNIRRGDVVVFRKGERMIAHRVLRLRGTKVAPVYLIKGDNNLCYDDPVQADEIVGRVLKIQRGQRWVAIDTPVWRKLNRLVAFWMIPWATLFGWLRDLRNRWLGPQAGSQTVASLRRMTLELPRTLLRLVELTYRWKK